MARSLIDPSDVVVKAIQTGFAPRHGSSSVDFPVMKVKAVTPSFALNADMQDEH